MTSTVEMEQDLCACGCKAAILPTDNHPWFKMRSCQNAWTKSPDLSQQERQVWFWEQRFFFCTVHNVPWGQSLDWEYVYEDVDVIRWANARLTDASSSLIHLDPQDPDALADALRIMSHYNWVADNDPDRWMARDRVPTWVFELRLPPRKPDAIRDALRQYGIIPASRTRPSV